MARPKQALLTRERIIAAASALVDAEGLEALSMRRLATELGVQGPSLYNHFATKAEIVDAVADAVAEQVDLSVFGRLVWHEALRAWVTHSPCTGSAAKAGAVTIKARQVARVTVRISS